MKEKKVPKKKPTWVEERKRKNQLEFTTMVSPKIGRDKKGAPISAPSIHISALVGAGSF